MSSRELAAVRLERTFAATPEEVFDAWTSPEVLTRWWAAQPSWTSPGCEVDLRVGGRYLLRMRDEDGRVYAVGGEYREVDRPRRLVYTWCWEGTDGPDPGTRQPRHGRVSPRARRHDRRARTQRTPLRAVAQRPRIWLDRRTGQPRPPDLRRGRAQLTLTTPQPQHPTQPSPDTGAA